jgi:hypothetical protein
MRRKQSEKFQIMYEWTPTKIVTIFLFSSMFLMHARSISTKTQAIFFPIFFGLVARRCGQWSPASGKKIYYRSQFLGY